MCAQLTEAVISGKGYGQYTLSVMTEGAQRQCDTQFQYLRQITDYGPPPSPKRSSTKLTVRLFGRLTDRDSDFDLVTLTQFSILP